MSVTEAANYMKVAGASIYVFDYIQTIPAEYRFYRKQKGFLRLSLACWLLIAVRYLGMVAIILALVGGFSKNFTEKSCDRFYLSVPIFKVLAAVASHGVFIFRTYAICGKDKTILYFLLVFGGLLSIAEIIAPVVVPRNAKLGSTGNCISDLSKGSTSWIQYLCQVVFDVVILGLTVDRLFRGTQLKLASRSEITRIFWKSQIMYFFAVTVVNIANLVFFVKFNKTSESTMLATLGMAVTAIFSSHVILDLQESRNDSRCYLSTDFVVNQMNGVQSTICRNGENVDRQFHIITAEESKSNAYRMDNLEAGGIHVQRDIVEIVDDQSCHSWERHHTDVKRTRI